MGDIIKKYNNLIEMIEEMTVEGDYSSQQIGKAVADKNILSQRDMATIIRFMSDITLNGYITSRKLNSACRYLVESEEKDMNTAIQLSGYSDQPTFSKAFKKLFDITPQMAISTKNKSLIKKPMTWDVLTGQEYTPPEAEIEETDSTTTVFGIPESLFNKAESVLDLEAFYGLPRAFSTYAYELSNRDGLSLEDCFRYANSLK